MSTIAFGQVYPQSGLGAPQTPLDLASAGGAAPDTVKLPMAAWLAMVVLLVVLRMLWESST